MKRLTLCAAMVLAFGWGESPASAEQCLAQSTPPTYTAGMAVPQVCDTHGTQKVMTVDEDGNYVAGGGGGSGDASEAEQQAQTAILTTIDGDTGTISTNSSTLAGAVKAEDAAHASGDTGVMSLCVRTDTAAARATTDGDYNPCQTDANGQLWVKEAGIGTSTDAAATAGSTGSLSAKQRLMTSQLDSIKTAVEALDSSIPAAGALADGTSNPTTTGVAAYNMCFNGTTWDRCTGTSTLHYATSAASTNATNIKASAGTVSVISIVNTTATLYYLRMYNLASAPTCSSATGFVNTIPVPASTSGAGIVIPITVPHAFTTGIGYCLTGGGSSTDNTNAATGVYINIWYK